MPTTTTVRRLFSGGAAGALVVAGAVLPASGAFAAPTECEPGYTNTSFTTSSSGFEPAGSLTVQNTQSTPTTVQGTVQSSDTFTGTVTGSVSVESIVSPVKAELSASASSSQSWTAGATIPIDIPANSEATVTYGYTTVQFSGSQKTCQSNGMFGPSTSFSGTLPTGNKVVV